ncbi:hypothetical protein [Roseomonas fluvialis]
MLVGGPDTIGDAERDADRLEGGAGADTMSGGAGNDVFDFNDILDSGVSSALRDVILDFTTGAVGFVDRIDLRDIDAVASTLTVNEAFVFRDTGAFTGAGQVRVVQSGADVIVELSTDLDIPPEMTIRLLNQTATAIESLDFLL